MSSELGTRRFLKAQAASGAEHCPQAVDPEASLSSSWLLLVWPPGYCFSGPHAASLGLRDTVYPSILAR